MNPQSPYPPSSGAGLPPTLPQPITMQPASQMEGGGKPIIWIILVVIFLLSNIGTAIWGKMQYDQMLHYKNDVEQIVADEKAKTKEETEKAKEEEFAEREKDPYRTYKGPSAFGSVQVRYPKTWSAFADEKDSGSLLVDAYMHPGFVPGTKSNTAFALRLEVLEQDYAQVMKQYDNPAQKGVVKVSPYKLKKVPSVLGSQVVGEIKRDFQGAAVYLPLRDKTIAVYTLSPSFVKDFNSIILPNLSFVP